LTVFLEMLMRWWEIFLSPFITGWSVSMKIVNCFYRKSRKRLATAREESKQNMQSNLSIDTFNTDEEFWCVVNCAISHFFFFWFHLIRWWNENLYAELFVLGNGIVFHSSKSCLHINFEVNGGIVFVGYYLRCGLCISLSTS